MKFRANNATPLAYEADAMAWAERFSDLSGFAFLDSRKRRAEVGQYDIITALPDQTFDLNDYPSTADWMNAIEAVLYRADGERSRLAIGFLDYDTSAAELGGPNRRLRPGLVGVYNWFILQDHLQGKSWLITDEALDAAVLETVEQRLERVAAASDTPFELIGGFSPEISASAYGEHVGTVKDYIVAGDCYQVNFAQRFSATYTGHAFGAYRTLRNVAPGDFSAYLALAEHHAVLSLSPERFLSIESGHVKTQPIKGTRPRHRDPVKDSAIARELRNSEKDRAENVMIVDLLRNDLGKLCDAGTVITPELCVLHSFDNVHHLVSMVEGQLRQDTTPGQALLGCSPGGSITGAPKRRAVEIIGELEQSPRGAYCGSVFVMGSDGWLQSSIAIRTLEALSDTLYCWGGGGIVYDSEADAEYQETLDKVGAFMRELER